MISEGQRVVPSIRTKGNAPMMAQLQRRSTLSEAELCSGELKVKRTDEQGHAVVTHPKLKEPFSCHSKFFEQAPQQ